QAATARQHPLTGGTQSRPRLPQRGGLLRGLQAEAVGPQLIETVALQLRILQVDVGRDLGAAERQPIAALAVGHAVAAVRIAGHSGELVAELQLAAHVFPVRAHAETAHRVPGTADHAAVKHAFQRVAAALIGAVGQPTQALALADRVTGHAIAADPVVLTHQPAAEIDADIAVAAA